jgi:hypothetical protein
MFNRVSPEVVYHDPTQPPRPGGRGPSFALAFYRAREYLRRKRKKRREKAGEEGAMRSNST